MNREKSAAWQRFAAAALGGRIAWGSECSDTPKHFAWNAAEQADEMFAAMAMLDRQDADVTWDALRDSLAKDADVAEITHHEPGADPGILESGDA